MNNSPNCDKQKKINTLYLTGFILLVAAFLIVAFSVISILWVSNEIRVLLFLLGIACYISGLVFLIVGVVRSWKNNHCASKLAIAGIIGVCLTVLFICFGYSSLYYITQPEETPPTTREIEPDSIGGNDWATGKEPWEIGTDVTEPVMSTMTLGSGPETINLWSYTDEVPRIVNQYIKQNPEFGEKYTVECTIIVTDDGHYQNDLDKALAADGDSTPDIYVTEYAFAEKYTQGNMAQYAMTYKDLGIDVDTKIKEADIAQYTVDIGTRDGEVVALGYESTSGVMIYNAAIAKDVFGTDDPEDIEKITGAGSGNWGKFFEAAEKLKKKGYAAISSPSDIWSVCEKSADKNWIVEDRLYIDPKREIYLDLAKTIKENGYSNNTDSWRDAWYDDMRGNGERKVFAYFGPSWFVNYAMEFFCSPTRTKTYGQWRVCEAPVGFFWGGSWLHVNKDTDKKEGIAELIEWITLDTSETGFQYLWANGLVDWDNDPETKTYKQSVASSVVMAKSDGKMDFCGGQDTFPVFAKVNNISSGVAISERDELISDYFEEYADKYAEGLLNRYAAREQFRMKVIYNVSY